MDLSSLKIKKKPYRTTGQTDREANLYSRLDLTIVKHSIIVADGNLQDAKRKIVASHQCVILFVCV